MLVSVFGNITVDNFVQPWKAPVPIEVISGNCIFSNFVQFKKALFPIEVI